MATGGGNSGGDPWAWLGLLKWSLNYSDGTTNASDIQPMSDEDKAFLETVMKEGIIDENERMKEILSQAATAMEWYQQQQQQQHQASSSLLQQPEQPPIALEDLEELLQELRDIVEQIDYARAFVSLKGLPFLLGVVSTTATTTTSANTPPLSSSEQLNVIPQSIRQLCLGILSTMCQNNPPVQTALLELGALKTLSDLYFVAMDNDDSINTNDDETMASSSSSIALATKLMQAIGSCVRNHETAEAVFCALPQTVPILMSGVKISSPSLSSSSSQQRHSLQSKTLLLVRALLTADTTTVQRSHSLGQVLGYCLDSYLLLQSDYSSPSSSSSSSSPTLTTISMDLIEVTLAMTNAMIREHPQTIHEIWKRKSALVAKGIECISHLRTVIATAKTDSTKTEDDYYMEQVQLEHWEELLVLLARASEPEPIPSSGLQAIQETEQVVLPPSQ